MTVLSGRATFGARSVLRALSCGVFGILGLIGCGNTTFHYGTPVISFSATPGPFTAYLVEVDQIALTRDDNQVVYPFLVPQQIDFAKLTDLTDLFGAPAVIEGTYVSASITVNYTSAQIFANVNGVSKAVTLLDAATGKTAGSITYTVKFDSAHRLVIKNGISSPIDFNFDLSASSALNTATSPMQLTVRPVMTASTDPTFTKPMRARGVFVSADTNASNLTMNARGFYDIGSNPVGAIQVNTDANTTYNISGLTYKGADGLAAIKQLSLNSNIEAYGALGSLSAIKPGFTATAIYAGFAISNALTDRIIGTVGSRSGNTLHIHGALVAHVVPGTSTGVYVTYANDIPLTVSDKTVMTVDGQPNLATPTIQDISVGQQVDIEATGTFTSNILPPTSVDATEGLFRLTPTTAWGTLNTAGQTTVNLLSLGGAPPEALTFTGTGSATGADSDPTAYVVTNSSTTNLSTAPVNTLVRFDGSVAAFGAAPPDFAASEAALGSDTEQVLTVEWVNGGTAAPFVSAASDGLTLDMAGANLGTTHKIQTGPLYLLASAANTVELVGLPQNPKIVADPAVKNQFSIGNPSSSTTLSVFQSYASYLTQINTVLNGTNKILKLVAVGKWDPTTNTFTAYRVNMVQLP